MEIDDKTTSEYGRAKQKYKGTSSKKRIKRARELLKRAEKSDFTRGEYNELMSILLSLINNMLDVLSKAEVEE